MASTRFTKFIIGTGVQPLPEPFIVGGQNKAFLQLEGGQVRFTTDGSTSPDATTGFVLNGGESLELLGPEVSNFKFLRTSAASTSGNFFQASSWVEYQGMPKG